MPHAFFLELTPLATPPKLPYLAHYTHGLFYHLLETIDPQLATTIHGAKRKPFTLAARQHREGITLRVTTLDDTLFKPLLRVVLAESLAGLALGQDRYRIARVLATPEGHPDAGFTPWQDILSAAPTRRLTLRFLTPTTFSTSRGDGKRHYTPLPIPRLILRSLLSSYQHHSPEPYSAPHAAGLETIFDEHLHIHHCAIHTEHALAGKTRLTGFTGSVTLHYPDQTESTMLALGQFATLAFYSGIGTKTPYGLGQVRAST